MPLLTPPLSAANPESSTPLASYAVFSMGKAAAFHTSLGAHLGSIRGLRFIRTRYAVTLGTLVLFVGSTNGVACETKEIHVKHGINRSMNPVDSTLTAQTTHYTVECRRLLRVMVCPC